jgi:acetaldehyde dehydrogenase / alcohol dehydrogenase
VPNARRGIRMATAVLRIGGAGHSAVIHSNDPATVMAYAAAVQVLRVTVNEGGSTGSAGFGTHLAPTMTIGTGYVGRSSLGENLEPKHLVDWTRVAYSVDASEVLPAYDGMVPWQAPDGPVPAYPVASNLTTPGLAAAPSRTAPAPAGEVAELREELRRLIVEELTTLIGR